jgi:flagellar hook assembly protein FlgD
MNQPGGRQNRTLKRKFKRATMKSHDKTPDKKQYSFSGDNEKKIELYVTEPGEIRLNISDAEGRSIYHWTGYAFKSGLFAITWNAKDNEGNSLPSGIYSYVIQSPNGNSTGKITLRK